MLATKDEHVGSESHEHVSDYPGPLVDENGEGGHRENRAARLVKDVNVIVTTAILIHILHYLGSCFLIAILEALEVKSDR